MDAAVVALVVAVVVVIVVVVVGYLRVVMPDIHLWFCR